MKKQHNNLKENIFFTIVGILFVWTSVQVLVTDTPLYLADANYLGVFGYLCFALYILIMACGLVLGIALVIISVKDMICD